MNPTSFGMTRCPARIFVLVVVLLMMGCSRAGGTDRKPVSPTATLTPAPLPSVVPITPSAVPTATPSATPTRIPPSATPTRIPPSATPTVTPTPTIPPEARLQIHCLPILPDVPPEMRLEGTLVLDKRGRPFGYLWNLEDGTDIPLPDNTLMAAPGVSPNGKWLVYTDLREARTWYRVVTADGEVHYAVPNDQEWDPNGPWLNNEIFLAYRRGEPLWSTIVVNPFTGQWREFQSDYPNIEWIDAPYRGWRGASFTASVYDPTLTRVVYLSGLPEPPYTFTYVIWDLQSNQRIAEIPSLGAASAGPVWSIDGQQFLIAKPQRPFPSSPYDTYIPDDELYSVSRDGEITQLTNLSAYFTVGVDIRRYVWSPDGRYIAFWIAPDPPADISPADRQMQLAVLDMESQMVTLYCIQADFRRGEWEPIWSPDSRQVLVKSLDENGESRLVVVDVVENLAVQIAGDVSPSGWMVSVP